MNNPLYSMYIYTLKDPRDNTIRYIGMSKDPVKRLASHYSLSDGTGEKQQWLRELRDAGFRPTLEILEKVEYPRMPRQRECYWIHFYLKQGEPLLNDLLILGHRFRDLEAYEDLHLNLPQALAQAVDARTLNRTAWIVQAIEEKLKREPEPS